MVAMSVPDAASGIKSELDLARYNITLGLLG